MYRVSDIERDKDGHNLCCCWYSCHCDCCCWWTSSWLKFLAWIQIIIYSIITVASILSLILILVTQEPERNGRIQFDWIETLLIVSFWAPWVVVTIPIYIVQLINHYFLQWFPILAQSFSLIDNGREMRGQLLTRFGLVLVFLVLGIVMAAILLAGVKKRKGKWVKVWSANIGVLIALTLVETIVVSLWGEYEPIIITRAVISMGIHGFSLGAAYVFLGDMKKEGREDYQGIVPQEVTDL